MDSSMFDFVEPGNFQRKLLEREKEESQCLHFGILKLASIVLIKSFTISSSDIVSFVLRNTILKYSDNSFSSYCHNPTNNPKQLKAILLGWYYYRLKKPTTTTTPPPGLITIRAVLVKLGS